MRVHAITIICYSLVRVQDSHHSRPHLSVILANTKLLSLDHQEMDPKIKKKKKCTDVVVDRFVSRNYLHVRKALPSVAMIVRPCAVGAEGWQKSQRGRAHGHSISRLPSQAPSS
jgi:hypothetical protein